MKSPSQMKVSLISFIVALIFSLLVFGLIAYFAISGFMKVESTSPGDDPEIVSPNPDDPEDTEVIPPDEMEKIEGESFCVLVAGYGLEENSFDAMIVIDINKEAQKVSIHPINVDTKVYVGHADGAGNINVRLGDLIKYRDVEYVKDKVVATTGLKVTNFVTFTAEGFIEAFDKFNEKEDYVYTVPKDMEHLYVELPEETPEETTEEAEENSLEKYNISFKKGDKLTSGIDVYNMLRFKGDSENERRSRQASFVREVLQKIIPSQFKEANLSKIITTSQALLKLTESIKSDVSIGTFITETFGLITKIPEFSFEITSKYTKGITNFK